MLRSRYRAEEGNENGRQRVSEGGRETGMRVKRLRER